MVAFASSANANIGRSVSHRCCLCACCVLSDGARSSMCPHTHTHTYIHIYICIYPYTHTHAHITPITHAHTSHTHHTHAMFCAGDTIGEWLNVLQSVQLPFALLPVLYFTSDARIMVRRSDTHTKHSTQRQHRGASAQTQWHWHRIVT